MAIVGKRQRWRQERAGREACRHLLLLPMETWTPFEELFLLRLIPVGMRIVSSGNSGNSEQLSGSPIAPHFFSFWKQLWPAWLWFIGSHFVPVPYCLDNCGFVVQPEVR